MLTHNIEYVCDGFIFVTHETTLEETSIKSVESYLDGFTHPQKTILNARETLREHTGCSDFDED